MDVRLNTLVSAGGAGRRLPLSLVVLAPLPDFLQPFAQHLLLRTIPTSCQHSIIPKGKLWQERAGPQSFPSSPKDFGGGQRAQQEETKQRIKVGDCQCQEKLNNPVTSMKVNSRSAAHGEYECWRDSECSSGVCPPRWAAFSPGTHPEEAGGGHALPTPGREQLPRIPDQAWGGGSSVA